MIAPFPQEALHQEPRTAAELRTAAEWFVWRMDPATGRPVVGEDGQPQYNARFAHLKKMTVERRGLLIRLMLFFLGLRSFRALVRGMGVDTPYTGDAMLEIAKIAFGSVIRPEYSDPGMQSFYSVIAPVYEFFHQCNTGVVPVLAAEDFTALGALPVGWIRTDRVRPESLLYPNDAVGRDDVAAELVSFLATRTPGTPERPLRILAVGDGPGLTAFKVLRAAFVQGLRHVEVVILEMNPGQIANGRRAWEHVGPELVGAGLSVRWVEGSGADDHFPEAWFDAAFSTYVVGAMGNAAVVRGYGRATLRALVPGGKHVALDFYDRRDDPVGFAETTDRHQRRARASARWMGWLSDPQLHQSYVGIWDHHVGLNDVLDEVSIAAGATFVRTHRQTTFAHIPVVRLGAKTVTFSFSGYNERKAVYTKRG